MIKKCVIVETIRGAMSEEANVKGFFEEIEQRFVKKRKGWNKY